ncbi:MAG: flavin reductase family protein [Treponema sp.]|jgi:flavin reductase (DIM6/NTAB) family NADH-FMN oxidoreductase RutF|nr:flavin reductase family protein [Treponema sp.]
MEQKSVVPAGKGWIEKNIRELSGSPVKRIGDDWALLSAGDTAKAGGNWNTMTVSWGGLGELWSQDVAFVFIRPHRYTREFVEANSLFTLAFFDKSHRKALAVCGDKSGRDIDKAAAAGLSPIVFDRSIFNGRAQGVIGFAEASEIIVCRKLYTHAFEPARFLDPAIQKNCYPESDYHTMYIAETVGLLVKG